jgi:hypothetical protein
MLAASGVRSHDRAQALRWFLVNRQSTHSWQKIVFIAESFLL